MHKGYIFQSVVNIILEHFCIHPQNSCWVSIPHTCQIDLQSSSFIAYICIWRNMQFTFNTEYRMSYNEQSLPLTIRFTSLRVFSLNKYEISVLSIKCIECSKSETAFVNGLHFMHWMFKLRSISVKLSVYGMFLWICNLDNSKKVMAIRYAVFKCFYFLSWIQI